MLADTGNDGDVFGGIGGVQKTQAAPCIIKPFLLKAALETRLPTALECVQHCSTAFEEGLLNSGLSASKLALALAKSRQSFGSHH